MRVAGRIAKRSGHGAAHLTWPALMTIALVLSKCLPIMNPGSTASPSRSPSYGGRRPVADFGAGKCGSPARPSVVCQGGEVCDNDVPGRVLVRTSNCNLHLTAAGAALVW